MSYIFFKYSATTIVNLSFRTSSNLTNIFIILSLLPFLTINGIFHGFVAELNIDIPSLYSNTFYIHIPWHQYSFIYSKPFT